jgi:hypothetical protein
MKARYTAAAAIAAALLSAGGATAGTLVTGAKIKDGTVTGRDIKDGSLLAADFKAGQLPAGRPGRDGASGRDGAPGAQGPAGPTPLWPRRRGVVARWLGGPHRGRLRGRCRRLHALQRQGLRLVARRIWRRGREAGSFPPQSAGEVGGSHNSRC